MYISGFEGSWFRHPFWRAGFLIEDEATLEKIRSSDVRAVIIDTRRGITAPAEAPAAAQPQAPSEPDSRIIDLPAARPGQTADAELERARSILHEGKALVTGLFNDARLGKLTVTQDVVALVSDIALSVERNHATLINMARLKSRDEYTYLHSGPSAR